MLSLLGVCAREATKEATKEFPYVFIIRSVRQGGHEGVSLCFHLLECSPGRPRRSFLMFSLLGVCAREATKEFPYVFIFRTVRQGRHEEVSLCFRY